MKDKIKINLFEGGFELEASLQRIPLDDFQIKELEEKVKIAIAKKANEWNEHATKNNL